MGQQSIPFSRTATTNRAKVSAAPSTIKLWGLRARQEMRYGTFNTQEHESQS